MEDGADGEDVGVLGLPDDVAACLFDLDGVLTDTAAVHNRAWTEMFDAYLRDRAERTGGEFVPSDPDADWPQYADGRRRADGVRAFLASRGTELPDGDIELPYGDIELPYGDPDDPLRGGPDRAAVFEDATSGIEAAPAGGFHRVVGVGRIEHATELRRQGADLVVTDLAELLPAAGR